MRKWYNFGNYSAQAENYPLRQTVTVQQDNRGEDTGIYYKSNKKIYRHSGMFLAGIQDGVCSKFLDPG
ncbi:MAG: hypothetical protein U9R66_08410 [Thermodesulfobacteriota bacterium]|nr:hypothetical protein [Thermodesulfobacteriota bacterium]